MTELSSMARPAGMRVRLRRPHTGRGQRPARVVLGRGVLPGQPLQLRLVVPAPAVGRVRRNRRPMRRPTICHDSPTVERTTGIARTRSRSWVFSPERRHRRPPTRRPLPGRHGPLQRPGAGQGGGPAAGVQPDHPTQPDRVLHRPTPAAMSRLAIEGTEWKVQDCAKRTAERTPGRSRVFYLRLRDPVPGHRAPAPANSQRPTGHANRSCRCMPLHASGPRHRTRGGFEPVGAGRAGCVRGGWAGKRV